MFEFSEEPRNNGKELLARFLKEKLEVGKAWGNYAHVLRVIPNKWNIINIAP